MSKAILAVYALIKDWQLEELEQTAVNYDVKLKDDITEEDLSKIEIIYGWNKDLSENKDKLSSLLWIQKDTAGLDSIPEVIRSNENILISNMSGVHAIPITENVFGFILAWARGIIQGAANQRTKQWESSIGKQMFSMKDKSILVYGAGSIGMEIARTAKFFGMKTYGVNSNGRSVECFDKCFTMDTVDDILASVNIVVNALPLTDASKHYYNESFFNKMNKEGLFINIGRGESVVDEDLKQALEEGIIQGAYLDVTSPEPLPADSSLWDTRNLVITPHVSGMVEHFRDEIYPIFKENLDSFLKNQTLVRNEYSRSKGY
ncbi:NAD(P)-dependent oxidoreductase [Aerococcaceae bacterium WGS1372]